MENVNGSNDLDKTSQIVIDMVELQKAIGENLKVINDYYELDEFLTIADAIGPEIDIKNEIDSFKGELDKIIAAARSEALNDDIILRYLNTFYTLLTKLVCYAYKFRNDVDKKAKLKKLVNMCLFVDCEIINEKLIVGKKHPMYLDAYMKLKYQYESIKRGKNWQTDIKLTPLEIYSLYNEFNTRTRFRLVYANDVYMVDTECNRNMKTSVPTKIFTKRKNLYTIKGYRILEKIIHVIKKNVDKKLVRIAVMGEIEDKDTVISLVGKMYPDVTITMDEFRCERVNQNGIMCVLDKQKYNLFDDYDLEFLANNYDLLLFMDQGIFYKRNFKNWDGNLFAMKELIENLTDDYYVKTLKGDLDVQVYDLPYWINILNNWIVSQNGGFGIGYTFNELLFYTLKNMAEIYNVETFCYISETTHVGELDLNRYLYCKSEYYSSYRNNVLRFPNKNEKLCQIADFCCMDNQDYTNGKVMFDVLKLLKSIDDNIYKEFKLNNEEDDVDILLYLRDVIILIPYEDALRIKENNLFKIEILYPENSNKKRNVKIARFVEEFFEKIIQSNVDVVSQRVQNIFKNTLLSSIARIDDAFFEACFVNGVVQYKRCLIKELNQIAQIRNDCEKRSSKNDCFKEKKTLFTIINELIKLKPVSSNMKSMSIMGEFKGAYCPQIETEDFKMLLRTIHGLCEDYQYEDSYLYQNTIFE